MRRKQNLASALGIPKENCNNISKMRQNIKQCMGFFPKLKLTGNLIIKVNVKNERRFDRPTVIFKFKVRSKN